MPRQPLPEPLLTVVQLPRAMFKEDLCRSRPERDKGLAVLRLRLAPDR
ncbi:hypothetical protein [Streptomyces sp. 35G-GA-8]|nr:hypothetical protein [Streptomyces sp. 35G-GA-8]MCL7377230.1 hypothetical protein [Streptomyces sp. 35G-GA-8]